MRVIGSNPVLGISFLCRTSALLALVSNKSLYEDLCIFRRCRLCLALLHPERGEWATPTAWMDGQLATFAIVTRPAPKSGFYLQPKGGFATAAHVALEAEKLLSENPASVGIAHTLPDGRTFFRPIWKFFVHPTADVAFGIPAADLVNERTGATYRPKLHSLTCMAPELGAAISTWAYPLHRVLGDEKAASSSNCNRLSTTACCKSFTPSEDLRPN